VRTAGANKDFEIRDRFPGLDPCPAPRHEENKADADGTDEPPNVFWWRKHNIPLADRVDRRHASAGQQHTRLGSHDREIPIGPDEDREHRLICEKGRQGHLTGFFDNCSTQPLSVPYFG
jgi:hypothetical protein